MERLWAPWRMEYIQNAKPADCIFCLGDEAAGDRHNLVLYRSALSFVMLNRYPYTNGHLMVAPFSHVADLEGLTTEERNDLFNVVRLSCNVLKNAVTPEGLNLGINLGKAAGAGVEDHLHVHIVPRWNGDTNFMSVIADLRVVPEGLMATYDFLSPGFRTAK